LRIRCRRSVHWTEVYTILTLHKYIIALALNKLYILQEQDQSTDHTTEDDSDNTEGIVVLSVVAMCKTIYYDYCLVIEWLNTWCPWNGLLIIIRIDNIKRFKAITYYTRLDNCRCTLYSIHCTHYSISTTSTQYHNNSTLLLLYNNWLQNINK